MGVGAGLYMYVVVVQKFTYAISSPDEFLFVYVAYVRDCRSSFGTLTIGRIAYRREKGDGSAQRVRSVIYDCLVSICVTLCVESTLPHALRQYRPNQYSLRN